MIITYVGAIYEYEKNIVNKQSEGIEIIINS